MTTYTENRPVYKVTGPRVLRSERAKLRTLRSTWITLGLALMALAGIGMIAAWRYKTMATSGKPMDPDFKDATALSLIGIGVGLGQLALGVLGVLFAAGEYSSGTIRSTLAAVPRRLPVLWSKTIVYAVVAFAVGLIGAVAGFLVADALVSGTSAHLSPTAPGVLRSLAGTGLYLALVGVIGVALGMILRSVAGGIATLVAVLLLVPGLLSLLPSTWRDHIGPYLPSNAGESIYSLHQATGMLSPGRGALVLLAWTALALGGAAWRLVGRDA